MSIRTTPDPWAQVRGQRGVMLTTFRREGRSVATPVGYGIDGPTLYFMTDPDTGKVKRLRHTSTVSLAASTLRGQVTGPALTGVAAEITGHEAAQGRRHITSTNRLAWFFLQRKARRAGWDWVVYAVRRDQSGSTQDNHADIDNTQHANTQETP